VFKAPSGVTVIELGQVQTPVAAVRDSEYEFFKQLSTLETDQVADMVTEMLTVPSAFCVIVREMKLMPQTGVNVSDQVQPVTYVRT
jgi:hypothetical protein